MVDEVEERTPCPFCAEAILPAARVCPHCGRKLPQYDGTGQRVVSRGQAAVAIAVGLVLAIVIAVVANNRVESNEKRKAKENVCEFMEDELGIQDEDCE